MNIFKKAVLIATMVVTLSGVTNPLNAQQGCYVADGPGCGYAACHRAPCITPAIALGTIALVAIIAVALQNSSGRGAHAHSDSE